MVDLSSPSSEKSPITHPSETADIILGKTVDKNDEDERWEEICKEGGMKDTPKSLGLKDGSSLAFSYKEAYQENGFEITRSKYYDEQSGAEEEEEEDQMIEDGEEDL